MYLRHFANESIAVVAVGLALSCASAPELEPAASAQQVPSDPNAARQAANGVRVTAESGWPGSARIEDELTPVRVTIENNSGKPLEIAYKDFELRGSPGMRAYRPLHLQDINGVARMKSTAGKYVTPRRTRNFSVSPGFAMVKPESKAYDTETGKEYASEGPSFDEVALPTQGMYQAALPEGVLANGGVVEGYLYFERVDDELQRVTLRARLEPARTASIIDIPFQVKRATR